ncbi:shikimate dehydrogenase [Rickettsiales bacterium LUAb2]
MIFKKVGLIGNNISYSISDIMHNTWIKKLNISAEYFKINLEQLQKDSLANYINDGFIGFNVTIPHKQKILDLIDELSDAAKIIKAVNTIYLKNNKIIADNSDYTGFIKGLLTSYSDYNFTNSNAIILGAGGAARAIIYALIQNNINQIFIWNRSIDKAYELKQQFNKKITVIEDFKNNQLINKCNLVVNCTSVGTINNNINSIFDFNHIEFLDKNTIFYDLVYNPKQTDFLKQALKLNFKILNGLPMLVYQAEYGFYKWFQKQPIIDQNFFNMLDEKLN